MTLSEDTGQRPLLGMNVRLDPRLARFLLDGDEMDDRLRSCARLLLPRASFDDLFFPAEFAARLVRLAEHAVDDLVVYCQGGYGVGKQTAAVACCSRGCEAVGRRRARSWTWPQCPDGSG